jgi:hypothetical protein
VEANRNIGGEPMVIPPALHAIYEDQHPFIVVRKPSQVGVTEFNLNVALWAADTGYAGRGVVLYVLPTQEMANRISQTRVAKAIADSPYLRRRATPEPGIARGPANVQRRTVGPGIIYFTGAEEETQYSGIDADVVILDEFDLMDEAVIPLAHQRLRSSSQPRMVVTSTPRIPDFGVSYLFDNSDQRRYELECFACSAWQTPTFRESVNWTARRVVCLQCGEPLDPRGNGRWVSENPAETAIRGYQLNRLVLPKPPLEDMRMAADGKIPTDRETFHRQDLGQPFASSESRLTPEILNACIGGWSRELSLRMCVMGIDVGSQLHVVIRGRLRGRWYLLEAFTAAQFEELEPCFKCYKIKICVVDARPEAREARRFQDAHRGVVWLAQYKKQGLKPEWSWKEGLVRAPRTLIIDETMRRFRERTNILPAEAQSLVDGDYWAHLLAPVRTTELDEWGQPLATYKNRRPDDFAHAEVYATLATQRAELGETSLISIRCGPQGWYSVPLEPVSDYDF